MGDTSPADAHTVRPPERWAMLCRMDMATRPKALVSWSSGKDSAWALHVLRQTGTHDIVGLVTTINSAADRVAMHAVRTSLLALQADAVGVPLWTVPIPSPCSNAEYDAAMARIIARAVENDVTAFAFGDLFLADIRSYREARLAGTGLVPLFPLWQRPTDALAREMLDAGLRATLTCVDPQKLPASFAGRAFGYELLADLPAGVDPCGENGEFHTCVHAGPMFRTDIAVRIGQTVERDGFVFADVFPEGDVACVSHSPQAATAAARPDVFSRGKWETHATSPSRLTRPTRRR
jgi:uncharacterized protein (TIGR00290 family)